MISIFTVLIALQLWQPPPMRMKAFEDRRELYYYFDRRDPMELARETLALAFIQRQNANSPLARALGIDDLPRKD